NDGDVVLVRALPGIGSRIVFAPGEKVIDIASGFTAGWKLKASHNILYLKPQSVKVGNGGQGTSAYLQPKAGKWDTNLMVRTNRHLYDFYLKLMPGSSSAAPSRNQRVAYRVQFRYPAAAKAQALAAARHQLAMKRMDAKPSP